jgi:alkylation response protein AidB-like acyl-CoA dehydrogenase
MIRWSEEQLMVRDTVRAFIDNEVRPNREALEFGDMPPYDLIRKMFGIFGMSEMAKAGFEKRIERERAIEAGEIDPDEKREEGPRDENMVAFNIIPIIELCRVCPGMVTAMGVSMGLTASAIMAKGTIAQKERWALDLLTLDKIGAWAITEPDSGSDAFGSMKSTARRDGEEYILNGSKTFITNGPHADTIVFICKLDEGNPPSERKVVQFVLDKGMEGLEQPKPFRKMGIHSSPTGMLYLNDVRVGRDRLLGESEDGFAGAGGKDASKASFSMERTGVAAMALGIVDRCLELCVAYAKEREQFGQPIGNFQLIQLKLAKMQVARMNLQNLVFSHIESAANGVAIDFADASAAKLYAAQAAAEVAMEAVQLHGGNGYMAEYEVEQLARDAKVLQIYAGTDEIQISQIARSLLAEDGGADGR